MQLTLTQIKLSNIIWPTIEISIYEAETHLSFLLLMDDSKSGAGLNLPTCAMVPETPKTPGHAKALLG